MDAPAANPSEDPDTTWQMLPAIDIISDPDILHQIFTHLSHEKHALAMSARTCSTFLDPALNTLWRSLDSLFPLFKILPSFIKSDGTYVIRGRIDDAHWARFDFYARRVKSFCYARDADALDIAMHVYFRIAQLRHTPLLPFLQHLNCPSLSQSDFLISAICLFLTPSLQILEFHEITNIEDKLVGTYLHTLHSDGAAMESITLSGHGLSKDTLSYVTKFEHIKSLKLIGMGENIDFSLLQSIGALVYLEDLEIDFSECALTTLDTSDFIGLANLRSLTITASLSFVRDFISRMAVSSHLITLDMITPGDPSFPRKEFLTGIASRWSTSLRRIALVHDALADELEENITTNDIAPLLQLHNMQFIHIKGYQMELSDDDILAFASAWPYIQSLLLPSSSSSSSSVAAISGQPTLVSLHTLAERCPNLTHLSIPLETANIPAFSSAKYSPWPTHHPLRILSISSSASPWDMPNLPRLARHIDYLFPHVECVRSSQGSSHDIGGGGAGREDDAREGDERWVQVQEMIKMYQDVRREAVAMERMYGNGHGHVRRGLETS